MHYFTIAVRHLQSATLQRLWPVDQTFRTQFHTIIILISEVIRSPTHLSFCMPESSPWRLKISICVNHFLKRQQLKLTYRIQANPPHMVPTHCLRYLDSTKVSIAKIKNTIWDLWCLLRASMNRVAGSIPIIGSHLCYPAVVCISLTTLRKAPSSIFVRWSAFWAYYSTFWSESNFDAPRLTHNFWQPPITNLRSFLPSAQILQLSSRPLGPEASHSALPFSLRPPDCSFLQSAKSQRSPSFDTTPLVHNVNQWSSFQRKSVSFYHIEQ